MILNFSLQLHAVAMPNSACLTSIDSAILECTCAFIEGTAQRKNDSPFLNFDTQDANSLFLSSAIKRMTTY